MRIDTAKSTAIALSKTKIVLLLLGAVAFVMIGVRLWTISDSQIGYNPHYVKLAAVSCVVFFSICVVYGFFKLFDSKPGLTIGPDGIDDNSSGVSAGHVPWNEIIGIDVTTISSQRFLVFLVEEPQKYVGRGNFLQRKLNAANLKLYGSPIQISSNSLKIDFRELTELVTQYYDRYKNMDNEGVEHTR